MKLYNVENDIFNYILTNEKANLYSSSCVHILQETEPDFNHCAVCIEGYQLNDVVRILPCK